MVTTMNTPLRAPEKDNFQERKSRVLQVVFEGCAFVRRRLKIFLRSGEVDPEVLSPDEKDPEANRQLVAEDETDLVWVQPPYLLSTGKTSPGLTSRTG